MAMCGGTGMTVRMTRLQRWVAGIIGAVLLVSLFSFLIVRSQQLGTPTTVTIGRAQSGSTITVPPGTTIHITVPRIQILVSHPSGVVTLVSRTSTSTTFRAAKIGSVTLAEYSRILYPPFPSCRYCANANSSTGNRTAVNPGGPCIGCTVPVTGSATTTPGWQCQGCNLPIPSLSSRATSTAQGNPVLPIRPLYVFRVTIRVESNVPVPSFLPGPSSTPVPSPLITPTPIPSGKYLQITVQDNNQTWYVPVGTILERFPNTCISVMCQSLGMLSSSNPAVLQALPVVGFAGSTNQLASPSSKPLLSPPVATFHPILGIMQRWQAVAPGTSVLSGTVSATCTGGAMCPDYIIVFRLTVIVKK
ncbi:MAG: hypothetical protein ACP5OR_04865 [Candidatus Dormibacteria bacterium]